MHFLRSRNFAYVVVALTVAAFALPGTGPTGLMVAAALGAGFWLWLKRILSSTNLE